jgi:hypothetical protein
MKTINRILPYSKAVEALINDSFQEAEMYTREHGQKIYNATRGGIIETFERVSFDSLPFVSR